MAAKSMNSYGNLKVGDKVQIKDGGIDVTNGVKAKKGRLYGQGGPLWAEIVGIYDKWETGKQWGLPAQVVKVRCANKGTVVWQVQPKDIYKQVITPDPAPEPDPPPKEPDPSDPLLDEDYDSLDEPFIDIPPSNDPFSPDGDSDKWYEGNKSDPSGGSTIENLAAIQPYISDSMFDNSPSAPSYKQITGGSGTKLFDTRHMESYLWRMGYSKNAIAQMITQAKKNGASKASILVGPLFRAEYKTNWDNAGRRKELLNADPSIIQNQYKFPFIATSGNANTITAAKYDYQIIPNDPRLPKNSPVANLEAKLTQMRASLGIPVHGNNDIARSMKMYMYNRYKIPDKNLAFNRTTTHVFFTRPDLNLLEDANHATKQVMNHTDTALLWRTRPELFKLLTSYHRCGDSDDLNLLLSNQVTSFNLTDERLATVRGGKSWAEHEMVYGEQYTGRTAGEFSCTFDETSEFSIINLMKLWITYIDNVSRGAWSPWYPHDSNGKVLNRDDDNCHVFDRALDYAASVYVFKCGPDGEEILYWSKYYGVFPIITGSSALSWDKSTPIGESPKLSIDFAYSFKKDLSPISLLEFNHVANAIGNMKWVPSYDAKYAGCTRPYVGSPYIEIDLGTPNVGSSDVNKASKKSQIRLKFRPDNSKTRSDSMLFSATKDNTAKNSTINTAKNTNSNSIISSTKSIISKKINYDISTPLNFRGKPLI